MRFFLFLCLYPLSIVLAADAPAPVVPATGLGPAEHQGSQQAVQQAADGTVTLHAKDATVYGETLRYEPIPQKNTLGFWKDPADWASWQFELSTSGKFDVEILQGCGKGSGGAEVELTIDEEKLPVTVQDTGGFQNFVARKVGTVALKSGKHTLSVKAKTKPGVAVMDLRQVTLKIAE